ncbi:MAG: archaetidylserine decarboxylase [Azoarcus sp.]|jgi:phosphatidylserine decarboxylase|nr:archaetidylserine decarboxylase [Azoarcus sp.]
MSGTFSVLLQYLLPKRALTSVAGKFSNWQGGAVTAAAIAAFAHRYRINMSEAEQPDLLAYASFNDFFTRALRPGARPLAEADLVCPVDGAISEYGAIAGNRIFQAKGHHYSTLALLGGDAGLAAKFENGSFATLYLSPRDYHRIHMPCAGRLSRMIHVPGSLFSVSPAVVRGVPGLFARNERVVCVFESESGPFALVLVGAVIVGSVATVWHGTVTPPRHRRMSIWNYEDRNRNEYRAGDGDGSDEKTAVELAQGAEMGRFMLGSTVIALFARPDTHFAPAWMPGRPVRMGEAMGRLGAS